MPSLVPSPPSRAAAALTHPHAADPHPHHARARLHHDPARPPCPLVPPLPSCAPRTPTLPLHTRTPPIRSCTTPARPCIAVSRPRVRATASLAPPLPSLATAAFAALSPPRAATTRTHVDVTRAPAAPSGISDAAARPNDTVSHGRGAVSLPAPPSHASPRCLRAWSCRRLVVPVPGRAVCGAAVCVPCPPCRAPQHRRRVCCALRRRFCDALHPVPPPTRPAAPPCAVLHLRRPLDLCLAVFASRGAVSRAATPPSRVAPCAIVFAPRSAVCPPRAPALKLPPPALVAHSPAIAPHSPAIAPPSHAPAAPSQGATTCTRATVTSPCAPTPPSGTPAAPFPPLAPPFARPDAPSLHRAASSQRGVISDPTSLFVRRRHLIVGPLLALLRCSRAALASSCAAPRAALRRLVSPRGLASPRPPYALHATHAPSTCHLPSIHTTYVPSVGLVHCLETVPVLLHTVHVVCCHGMHSPWWVSFASTLIVIAGIPVGVIL
ncbi:hypothetical protein DENSPDRAFT_934758 [Dentipellis sp. KUC8613]|nr:hypothetical protein DENSPDRAFT_934758 [Dentipellis sp. KUC8613]